MKNVFKSFMVFIIINSILIVSYALVLSYSALQGNIVIVWGYYCIVIILLFYGIDKLLNINISSKDTQYIIMAVFAAYLIRVLNYYCPIEYFQAKIESRPDFQDLIGISLGTTAQYLAATYHEYIYRVKIADYVISYKNNTVVFITLIICFIAVETSVSFFDFSIASGIKLSFLVLLINFCRKYIWNQSNIKFNAFLIVIVTQILLSNKIPL